MPFNVVQDSNGIFVNNVLGAVKADVVDGALPADPITELFYGSYPKDTIDITTFTGFAGLDKWIGAVQGPNGKIYFIPFDVYQTKYY